MIYNEIEFVTDCARSKSFYDVDSSHEYAKLKKGDEVEIDFNDQGPNVKYIVKEVIFEDYNIRGLLLQYKLRLKMVSW